MPDLDSTSTVFSSAVNHFWRTRDKQIGEQQARGSSDQGHRAAVTGGKQLDGFLDVLAYYLEHAGVRPDQIHRRSSVETVLPGYYRPTKQWDLLVVRNGQLSAAIELKSQVGPSFGNNFNNRTEEAIGSAEDLWTAFREGAFGNAPSPWLGYLFLLEDCSKSREPVRVLEPHFGVFPEYQNASYAKRYEFLCRKLVLERKYNAACFLMSRRPLGTESAAYEEPAHDLSTKRFLSSLIAQVSVF